MSSPERAVRVKVEEFPLQCVWSGHTIYDHHCRAMIPARKVAGAWRRELALGAPAGFFHFDWRGEEWLAYGLPGGEVRGVYCPTHRAEREERLGYDPQLVPAAAVRHAS